MTCNVFFRVPPPDEPWAPVSAWFEVATVDNYGQVLASYGQVLASYGPVVAVDTAGLIPYDGPPIQGIPPSVEILGQAREV